MVSPFMGVSLAKLAPRVDTDSKSNKKEEPKKGSTLGRAYEMQTAASPSKSAGFQPLRNLQQQGAGASVASLSQGQGAGAAAAAAVATVATAVVSTESSSSLPTTFDHNRRSPPIPIPGRPQNQGPLLAALERLAIQRDSDDSDELAIQRDSDDSDEDVDSQAQVRASVDSDDEAVLVDFESSSQQADLPVCKAPPPSLTDDIVAQLSAGGAGTLIRV
jgi:hypothetical protein